MTELIISEKPDAAKNIANALADSAPKKLSNAGVPYYTLTRNGKEIIVGCAVGHLYTVGEKEKTTWDKFPIYDVMWIPTYEADKGADYSKKYLMTLMMLAKKADSFTVACDYDIEGEVIGLNIIRKICKAKDASRMKFSTLTKPDLEEAYQNKSKTLDWGQANAGETRHILDFYYGINLTRALTHAVKIGTGSFKLLSSGRVQGPALKIIVDREKEIKAFIPVPYWQIELDGTVKNSPILALHAAEKFWEKEKADAVMRNVKGKDKGIISKKDKKQTNQKPPFPFDLTSLQIEAYRCFKIKPKQTLEVAQKLYTSGVISYPRTSSQKLPAKLGFKNILTQLQRQSGYKALAAKVLQTKLIPYEGQKTDAAHPAIYPTGIAPDSIEGWDEKIYDLIVRRFFAVFGEDAIRETNTLWIDVNKEEFVTKGTVTIFKGWHEYYGPYVKLEDKELPVVDVGDIVSVKTISCLSKETKPPNRYTQSSIIHALEKKELGTKATRAQIVDTLFQRGYVVGDQNIEATELGIQTTEVLMKYSPDILDEELTRRFEKEMDKIREKEMTGEQVLKESRDVLDRIIIQFRKHEKDIGKELAAANQEAIKIATELGPCPVCKQGVLSIRRGKFGKFAACGRYPDCKTTFNLPRTGIIKPIEKRCEACGYPMISVKLPKKGPQELCINPECPTKKVEGSNQSYPEEGMTCPACGKGKMVLRKSFYGQFLGCDQYPRCKTMMKIVDGKVDTKAITKNNTNTVKKTSNKTTDTALKEEKEIPASKKKAASPPKKKAVRKKAAKKPAKP